ncbi:hypothetical protein IFM89_025304 [Coptis chinensis]|uniref:Copper transport protein n=1 Tax=Coptis chinensis TaxID=261450 RepID=A0A835HGY1_9MAGN|nr:hypothetical protein IFM89_025304 [Coptis chinensis]
MDGMHHGMGDHNMSMPMPSNNNGTTVQMHHKMMMHMSFYWGKNAEILFSGWPGTSTGMYVLSLIVVFLLSLLVEWISHSKFIKKGSSHVSAGLLETLMHTIRSGLSYLVMLAVMSFNGGVFIVAVAGHSVGFLVFRSRDEKPGHLPPITC